MAIFINQGSTKMNTKNQNVRFKQQPKDLKIILDCKTKFI